MMICKKNTYNKPSKAALNLLNDFEYYLPPVCPIRISNGLGIKVYFATLSEQYSKIVAGFFDYKEKAIYINKSDHPSRQIFTIAHELGHKVLHGEWVKSSEYKILLKGSLMYSSDKKDKEANTFAANLLVPRFMLDHYYLKYGITSEEELADIFGVPKLVITNRINFEYGI